METPANSTIKRAKKACTECRQQKARCDVQNQSPDPCSRCRRLSIQCVISDPFKRRNKRQKISELEEETRLLRQELSINANRIPSGNGPSTEPIWSQAPQSSRSQSVFLAQRNEIGLNAGQSAKTAQIFSAPTIDKTIVRSLDDIQIDAETIDNIFQLYFQRYHPFMPILDPLSTPNSCYHRSPLTFWAIIGVAYPSYSTNRAVIDSLFTKIYGLAFSCINPKHASTFTVEGLLVVLNWPTPLASLSKDTQFPLSGAMLHVAMQMGLHMPRSSQDFARVKINLSDDDVTKRAELWAHCLLVYERVCSCQGLAPTNLVNIQRETGISTKISCTLKFQMRVQGITSRCCIALQEHGLKVLSPTQEHSLTMMLHMFEGQLKDVEVNAGSTMEIFLLNTCRMLINNFYFFLKPSSLQNEAVIKLYTSASYSLALIDILSKQYDLRTSPFYFSFAVALSCYVFIRLLKSPAVKYLNEDDAKSKLFESMQLMHQVALPGWDDLARRNTPAMHQMLRSEKAFKQDGKDFSMLRIRSRLAMSPVFDAAWWWREEFGGQMGAYTSQQDEGVRKNQDLVNQSETMRDQGGVNLVDEHDIGLETLPSEFWDENLLAEFGWLGDEEFLEPRPQDVETNLSTE